MQASDIRSRRPRVVRPHEGRRVAGVAAGIGNAFGIDPNHVRLAFVVLALAGGAGVALYGAAWLVLPSEGSAPALPIATARRSNGGWDLGQAIALGAIVLGSLLLLRQLRVVFVDSIVWPAAIAGIGAALLWTRVRPDERAGADPTAKPWSAAVAALVGDVRRPSAVARVVGGALLVVAAGTAFLATNHASAARQAFAAVVVLAVGLGLVFGPWLWRLATDLSNERNARIRSQERAEVAAHLHDSVLHTLALVRRSAEDPRQVVRLARRQERELRTWLAGGAGVDGGASSLAAALDDAANDVEADHGVPIDVVKVGDCRLDDGASALVRAAREAMINASKHARAESIAVYLEVDESSAAVFVRDRGVGFTIDDVGADRHGLAESITGRMERHHGSAVVRTAPGAGTEVQLTIPRARS